MGARGGRAFVCVSHSPFMNLPDAQEQGARYRAAVDDARTFIDEFGPDAVVVYGPDHMNMLVGVRPPFTTVLSGRTHPEFSIPEITLTVAQDVATSLCEGLLAVGVDMAVGEGVAVDHGLGLTITQLFDDPEAVPLVPVVVNAIGYPLVPLHRVLHLGDATARVLADRRERILFVGTGGLSHNPPFPAPAPGARRLDPQQRSESLASAAQYVDPQWDREVLNRLANGDSDWFARLSQDDLDRRGCGANEIRTWLAAWAACGRPAARTTAYEPVYEWITGMGVAYGVQR